MRFLLFVLVAPVALAQLGPDYQRPAFAAPPRFKGTVSWREARPSDHLPKGDWWRIFCDPALTGLMKRATTNNQQLKAAIARFDQARAVARMARSDFFPMLTLPASIEHQRTSENMPSPFPLNGLKYDGPAYNLLLDLTWEIDLWGKYRRRAEGARADAAAAADTMHNIHLGIQAELAANYFRLRALDEEIRIVREAVAWRNESLKIVKARVQAGAANDLELAQAETEVSTAESEIPALQAQRDQLENAIAILVGEAASSLKISARLTPVPSPPGPPPAGLPSDLLERRPDVSSAERALAATTARIGVAKAEFFPSIRLLGRGGLQSGDIDLLLSPESLMWNTGSSIAGPLFAGNKNRYNLERSRAAHDAALADYRQAFLAAVADVENSLSAARHLETQFVALQSARTSAASAATLAKTRYEAGTSPYLDFISANRTALVTQRASVQVAGQRLVTSVSLIKALGGGWDQSQTGAVPVTTSDPAARSTEERGGFLTRMRSLFSKKDK